MNFVTFLELIFGCHNRPNQWLKAIMGQACLVERGKSKFYEAASSIVGRGRYNYPRVG